MSGQVAKRLISVEEYHKMAEVGILKPDDRVELINGEIITMSPVGSPHASSVKRITALFFNVLMGKVTIGVQDPIQLSNYSEPEPDISILKYRPDFYEKNHPAAVDIYWVIEVAHSTLGYDRDYKVPFYAASDVQECWVVDVENKVLEVYRELSKGKYQSKEIYKSGDVVKLSHFDFEVSVSKIVG